MSRAEGDVLWIVFMFQGVINMDTEGVADVFFPGIELE